MTSPEWRESDPHGTHAVPAAFTVLIAGAGPTGLVLALWLTKSGVAVRIIDKAADAGTSSRALGVQARTLELYDQMGIADAVLAGGVDVGGANFWVAGRRVARIGLADAGKGLSPFAGLVCYQQDAHERMLIARLLELGVTVERNTELLRFSDDGTVVRSTLAHEDGSEEECEASYLAGCDGAHSAVRAGLAIAFTGGTYDALFYVADADVSGPVANKEVHVDFDSSDFLAVFPMRTDGRVRLIGAVNVNDSERRDLTFDDVGDQAMNNLKITIDKVNWFSTYRVHHRVAESFRKGRAFILGDAAHVHSPVGAQGMNTGIGDAINLAWKLAAVSKGEAPATLLDSFEPERIAFARQLVSTTDRAFTLVSKRGSLAAFVRTKVMPLVVPLLARSARMRTLMFLTVSQIGIRYRESTLSVGSAGQVHGGTVCRGCRLARVTTSHRSHRWRGRRTCMGSPKRARRPTARSCDFRCTRSHGARRPSARGSRARRSTSCAPMAMWRWRMPTAVHWGSGATCRREGWASERSR